MRSLRFCVYLSGFLKMAVNSFLFLKKSKKVMSLKKGGRTGTRGGDAMTEASETSLVLGGRSCHVGCDALTWLRPDVLRTIRPVNV